MKQFKIIESADLSTVNVDNTGIITANFAMPITIDVGSSISLDKFTTKIRNEVTTINIPTQTIGVQYDLDLPYLQFDIAGTIVPVNLFSLISDKMNTQINAVEDVSQLGLQMYWDINAAKISVIGYQTIMVEDIEESLLADEMALQTDELYIYTGSVDGEFGLTALSQILLTGGGFQLSFDLRPDKVDGDYEYQVGLTNPTQGYFEIHQVPYAGIDGPNEMYINSNIGPGCNILIDAETFYPDGEPALRTVVINQINGFFYVRIMDEDELVEDFQTDIPWSPTVYTNGNTLADSLSLTFFVRGFLSGNEPYAEATDNPGFGHINQTTEGGTDKTTALRTVTIDLSEAGYIQTVFDLPDYVICSPGNSSDGSYTTTKPYDFSVFRGNPDIAIEFLDLALESYASGLGSTNNQPTNGVRQPGARCNVLAYFTPLESTVNKTFYSYAQSSYQFLSLANKTAVTFTSLSFRIFSPSSGQPLLADEISFNFLVKGPNE